MFKDIKLKSKQNLIINRNKSLSVLSNNVLSLFYRSVKLRRNAKRFRKLTIRSRRLYKKLARKRRFVRRNFRNLRTLLLFSQIRARSHTAFKFYSKLKINNNLSRTLGNIKFNGQAKHFIVKSRTIKRKNLKKIRPVSGLKSFKTSMHALVSLRYPNRERMYAKTTLVKKIVKKKLHYNTVKIKFIAKSHKFNNIRRLKTSQFYIKPSATYTNIKKSRYAGLSRLFKTKFKIRSRVTRNR